MELLAYLKKLFTYDDWANREVIRNLQELPHSPLKAVRLMAHVVAVEYLWLARLKREPSPVVWPEWTITEIVWQQEPQLRLINDYLASLPPAGLEERMEYTNSKGERWTNTVDDILMHVVMHSAYHRGQIAMVLRDAGIVPPYTDFIQAVRGQNIRE